MDIRLSDHFTYKKLLRFCLSPIIMMVFTSIYGVVDGLFVSNFVGKIPFAAINLIMPFVMVLGGIGFMIGTGGSALVAKTLGEGDGEKANRYFTMMIWLTVISGVITSVAAMLFMRPISYLLGATEAMIDDCVVYGNILLAFNTAFMLQNIFQTFLATAEKPKLGMWITVAAGVSNMVLDALFVGLFQWGVAGAAVATGISQCVGGIIPLIYFMRPNDSLLRLTKTGMEAGALIKACVNGSSELMSSISSSIVGILYNFQLLKYAGEDGIAAYGALMYVQFIFIAAFIGYTIGTSPVVGFHYGAENHAELKSLLKKSNVIMVTSGIAMGILSYVLAPLLAGSFVGYDADLYAMALSAFKFYSFSFLLVGLNIFASSFFTALNNGAVSAAISFLRTLVFQTLTVLILPEIMGLDGIWWAKIVTEVFAFAVSFAFLFANRKKYHYV